MMFNSTRDIRIVMPKTALLQIFDECDQFDHDETGGRILGTFTEEKRHLKLKVSALIDSGPRARRSAVMFFQDGDYQEQVFRKLESRNPEIEHLGNWHTHHMNGLQHLSSGDLDTYHRIVNHPKQNTPFFYALLVVSKLGGRDPLNRYSVKHYMFRKGDPKVYEIPQRMVELVDEKLLNSSAQPTSPPPAKITVAPASVRTELISDQEFVKEFFPNVRPFQSPKLGVYWKGVIELVNREALEVVAVESSHGKSHSYSLVVREVPSALEKEIHQLSENEYPSARAALIHAERTLNRTLYSHRA